MISHTIQKIFWLMQMVRRLWKRFWNGYADHFNITELHLHGDQVNIIFFAWPRFVHSAVVSVEDKLCSNVWFPPEKQKKPESLCVSGCEIRSFGNPRTGAFCQRDASGLGRDHGTVLYLVPCSSSRSCAPCHSSLPSAGAGDCPSWHGCRQWRHRTRRILQVFGKDRSRSINGAQKRNDRIPHQLEKLNRLAKTSGFSIVMGGGDCRVLWRGIRGGQPFASAPPHTGPLRHIHSPKPLCGP